MDATNSTQVAYNKNGKSTAFPILIAIVGQFINPLPAIRNLKRKS